MKTTITIKNGQQIKALFGRRLLPRKTPQAKDPLANVRHLQVAIPFPTSSKASKGCGSTHLWGIPLHQKRANESAATKIMGKVYRVMKEGS